MEYFNVSSMVRSTVNNNKPKKILHIITGLGDGGAEGVLSRLCLFDDSSKHIVISLMGDGKYGPILRGDGVEVICLGLGQSRFSLRAFLNLIKIIKKKQPDVVQTWMYHADLIGGLAARLAGIKNIFWGIRHSTLEPGKSKRSTILIAKLCAHLSYVIPKKIICCAHDALNVHRRLGYSKNKLVVIKNGYDLNKFKPDLEAGLKIRDEFQIKHDEFLIGTIGRYDPQKDHLNLLKSLNVLLLQNLKFKCILVGKGLTAENKTLANDITRLNLANNIVLAGTRGDVPAIMNALNLHVLPSAYGEGFPNVVAEAMACETPCIATDVGDAREIVLNNNFLANPKDSKDLANKIKQYYFTHKHDSESIMSLKNESKNKIVLNHSLDGMVERFLKVWDV